MSVFEDAFTLPLNFGDSEDPASRASHAVGLRDVQEATEDMSGVTAANAARTAAELQEQFGREALSEQDIAQRRLEATLAPFVGFGASLIPEYNNLFQSNASDSATASQNITDLTSFANNMIMSNPAVSKNAQSILNTGALLNAPNLLSRERGDLLSALGLGQASAAQQGAAGLQTGQNRLDLLSQIGNAQSAGKIGSAQAYGQGAQNLAGLGSTLATQYFGG